MVGHKARHDRVRTPESLPRTLIWLIVIPLVFFATQLLVGGDDGVFAMTTERVMSPLLRWTVLNMPLQLVLAAVTALLAQRSATRRSAYVVGVLNVALVAGHVIMLFATA